MQGIATVIYIATHARGAPLTQDVLLNDKTYIVMAVASIVPAHLLTIGIAWAIASRFGKVSPLKTLGFGWPENFGLWKSVGLAIVLIVVAMGLLYSFGGADTQLDTNIAEFTCRGASDGISGHGDRAGGGGRSYIAAFCIPHFNADWCDWRRSACDADLCRAACLAILA